MADICEYCGGTLKGGEAACPHCGAPVPDPAVGPTASGSRPASKSIPTTIEELLAFARDHRLPLAKMRVFIGEDYKSPKAFGIFRQPDGTVVVYKNKADGSRAIRYQGPDEARGVRELYEKMHDMVRQQKAFQTSVRGGSRSAGSGGPVRRTLRGLPDSSKKVLMIFGIVCLMFFVILILGGRKKRGYYHYNGDYYYRQNSSWYIYQGSDWIPYIVDQELADHAGDYYESDGYRSSYGISSFEDSDYYVAPADNDDDDDWDWGGGDWDDIGDWDSDW